MLLGKLASSSDRTKRAVVLEADGIDRKIPLGTLAFKEGHKAAALPQLNIVAVEKFLRLSDSTKVVIASNSDRRARNVIVLCDQINAIIGHEFLPTVSGTPRNSLPHPSPPVGTTASTHCCGGDDYDAAAPLKERSSRARGLRKSYDGPTGPQPPLGTGASAE
jgi:hypothetical protein